MGENIRPIQTERGACVYVRQSSMQQFSTRLEGQRRQCDLRERAQLLGFQRVTVIGEDQGRTGTGSVECPWLPSSRACGMSIRFITVRPLAQATIFILEQLVA